MQFVLKIKQFMFNIRNVLFCVFLVQLAVFIFQPAIFVTVPFNLNLSAFSATFLLWNVSSIDTAFYQRRFLFTFFLSDAKLQMNINRIEI